LIFSDDTYTKRTFTSGRITYVKTININMWNIGTKNIRGVEPFVAVQGAAANAAADVTVVTMDLS